MTFRKKSKQAIEIAGKSGRASGAGFFRIKEIPNDALIVVSSFLTSETTTSAKTLRRKDDMAALLCVSKDFYGKVIFHNHRDTWGNQTYNILSCYISYSQFRSFKAYEGQIGSKDEELKTINSEFCSTSLTTTAKAAFNTTLGGCINWEVGIISPCILTRLIAGQVGGCIAYAGGAVADMICSPRSIYVEANKVDFVSPSEARMFLKIKDTKSQEADDKPKDPPVRQRMG